MQCPRDPGLFNEFYLAAKRILGLVPFTVFRIEPWDEGVWDAPGSLDWRGGFGGVTEAVLVREGRFKLSEPEPFHSLSSYYS